MSANKYEFDKSEIVRLSSECVNLAHMTEELGYNVYNTNYRKRLVSYMVEHGITIPKGHRRTKPRRALEEMLVITDTPIQSTQTLKVRLLAEGLLDNSCYADGCEVLGEWLGSRISLHLDHINGDRRDNRLSNLRMLCPNCHSQTPTYAGRNIRRKGLAAVSVSTGRLLQWLEVSSLTDISKTTGHSIKLLEEYLGGKYDPNYLKTQTFKTTTPDLSTTTPRNVYDLAYEVNASVVDVRVELIRLGRALEFEVDLTVVCLCGRVKGKTSKECLTCERKLRKTKIDWPPVHEMLKELETKPYTRYAKELGVSDNAIRKHLSRTGNSQASHILA